MPLLSLTHFLLLYLAESKIEEEVKKIEQENQ